MESVWAKSQKASKASVMASAVASNVRKGELPSVKSVKDGVSQKMRTLRSNLGHSEESAETGIQPDQRKCSPFVRVSISHPSDADQWRFLGQTNTE